MRKISSIVLLVMVIMVSLILIGCDMSTSNPNQLATPNNLRIEDSSIKWNPVDYASSYQIKINSDIMVSDSFIYNLSDLEIGISYDLSVRAIGDGDKYLNSD